VAQTKKKRRRKHSGTQAGTVQRQPRRARPQTKEEKREEGRRRRLERLEQPPTLRSAIVRAAVATAIFIPVAVLMLGAPLSGALILGTFMFAFYIPAGYYFDLFLYRRRQRKKERERAARKAAR
jgi:Flp pilus assembly protein TadB